MKRFIQLEIEKKFDLKHFQFTEMHFFDDF